MIGILQVARALRPGTAWTMKDGILFQAEDGTPRVDVPTDKEIQEYILTHPDPVDTAKDVLKDRTATASDRLDAVVQILGL